MTLLLLWITVSDRPIQNCRWYLRNCCHQSGFTGLSSGRTEDALQYALGTRNLFSWAEIYYWAASFSRKKVEYIYQEDFARLIMYNFSELITSSVIIQKADAKYVYKANFSAAVHVCRQFFLGNVSPPDVEALIRRHVSPIRPGRSRPRKMTVRHAVSFIYRVA